MKSEKKLTLYWQKILSPLIGVGSDKAGSLARVITGEIDKGVLSSGELIASQRLIQEYTGFSKSTVEAAFKIMREYSYVETTGAGGTKVSNRDSNAVKINDSGSHPRVCHFDSETIFPNEPIMKKLMSDVKRAESISSNLTPQQRKAHPNEKLIDQFKLLVNNSLPAAYRSDQICYAFTLEKAIDSICRLFLDKESQFIMLDPAEIKISEAVKATTNLIQVIKKDCDGISIAGLERACAEGSVGILYLCSRRIVFENKRLHKQKIIKILELKRKYGFSIIEDDLYADFYRHTPNIFMDIVSEMNENVFYLRAIAMNLNPYNQFIIIGGPQDKISDLKNIISVTGDPINGYKSNVLLHLMTSRNLAINQNKLYKHTIEMNKCARKVLTASNLFKAEGIDVDEGWFFYLIPKNGSYPPNIYQLLTKRGIYVMNPDEYMWTEKKVNMLIISIAKSVDAARLTTDLEYLIEALTDILKTK